MTGDGHNGEEDWPDRQSRQALGQPAGADVPVGDKQVEEPEPDFADEQRSPTVADQMEGGPERSRAADQPEGYSGMD